jgi:hypothetical protein
LRKPVSQAKRTSAEWFFDFEENRQSILGSVKRPSAILDLAELVSVAGLAPRAFSPVVLQSLTPALFL